jgi:transcriptional regulator
LAIFLGVDHYVSPTWYREEPDVPTWNYVAVHARASWRPLASDGPLRALLHETVDHFEQERRCPWSLDQLDPNLAESLQRGVIGFELEVGELLGVRKLSQDKCPGDRQAVELALAGESTANALSVSEEMRRDKS